MITRPSIF